MIPFEGTFAKAQWYRGIRLAMRPTGFDLVARSVGVGLVFVMLGAVVVGSLHGEEVNSPRLLRSALSIGLLTLWLARPYVRAWRVAAQPWRSTGNAPSHVAALGRQLSTIAERSAKKTVSFLEHFGLYQDSTNSRFLVDTC